MWARFHRDTSADSAARRLYAAAVARARDPSFHRDFRVPDTIDGRFDLLTLHLFLAIDRIREEGRHGTELADALVTLAFAGFEDALRELGVSDIGLPRRIKAMAGAFYGRLDAYSAAGERAPELADALLRNLFRGDADKKAECAALAHYIISVRSHLRRGRGTAAILAGDVESGPLPEF